MIRLFDQAFRVLHIYYVFLKYGLDRALFRLPLLKTFKFVVWFNPFYWRLRRLNLSRGERLTLALESLGPIFVKLGQLLSTRRDILPEDISIALSKLQDQVQAFETPIAKTFIEQALGAPLDQIFLEFQSQPLASASIAQVYAARLKTGEDVVVKVLRPNVRADVSRDLSILKKGASFLSFCSKTLRRLNLVNVVQELERTLRDELDLIKEAANASQLKRNFKHRKGLYIPHIYWDYSRKTVLTMERLHGIPILNKQELLNRGFHLKDVGEQGLKLFYTQVFEDSFFHADLHPGNLFIQPDSADAPQWMLVDFGIMGSLSRDNQHYLAANFLAFIERDYRRVAELHLESGWVPANVRVDVLEAAIRSVCEPIFELPPRHISLGQTLLRLLLIAQEFHMEVMPEMLLLQKSLINIEGVVKFLDPEIDIWAVARPLLKRWMKRQTGILGLFQDFKKELPLISDKLPELPSLLYHALKRRAYEAPPPPSPSPYRDFYFGLGMLALGLVFGFFIFHTGY